jgi:SAM-dependent methyltransferase
MRLDVNTPGKWEADYAGHTDGWDLGGPTGVLQRLATTGVLKPGKMFVPCAGRGHDAREFARHGFEVMAVDFAPHAVREMRRLADATAPMEIVERDIFDMPAELDATFDYVLEYTCFCAIDPKRRAEYADVVWRLLKPGGLYIDLAFPMDDRPGGPPYSVSEEELVPLFRDRGFELVSREAPTDSVAQRRQAEQLFIFKKNA